MGAAYLGAAYRFPVSALDAHRRAPSRPGLLTYGHYGHRRRGWSEEDEFEAPQARATAS
jgi:hypothetical protein